MIFTIIIPVLYLTDYSRCALKNVKESATKFDNINFLLPCTRSVENELLSFFNTCENVQIIAFNTCSSNFLRFHALKYVNTEYVYYQDCDDIVSYQILLKYRHKCNGLNTICFNITKRVYDESGEIIKQFSLYSLSNGPITTIQNLPTNIVNKLIPLKILLQVDFYNIPFSQDLSLSYQLYELSVHEFVREDAYLYENNAQSTSGIKKTKYNSLLRVVAVKKILVKKCNKSEYHSAYIQYRYEMILSSRFAFLNVNYFPLISLKMFNPSYWGILSVFRHAFYYLRACYSFLKTL